MPILIVAEHNNVDLKPSTLNVVSAAYHLEEEIDILVAGENCASVSAEVSKIQGIRRIYQSDHPAFSFQSAEALGEATSIIGKDYQYIMSPATTFGKNFLPRTAALLDVTHLSDVIAIENKNTFIRPIYAGNALATVRSDENIKIMTIRTTAFPQASQGSSIVPIETVPLKVTGRLSEFIERIEIQSKRPELTAARVIIAGGRGLQSGENFKFLEELADLLQAGLGASRAAVDAGFVPNDYQIGQTGKIVAPELYIAIGISGAIQHLAGMKDSKIIVAINKDAEAPIFQIADYGLVGDLFVLLPQLIQLLKKLKNLKTYKINLHLI